MNARTLAPLALLLAAGCGADNFASVEFFAPCSWPAPSTTGGCTFAATCDTVMLDTPLVDVEGALSFLLPIEMINQLTSNADPTTGRANTNDAHITQYTMTYSVPGAALPGSVALVTHTVPTAGTAVVIVEVLPSTTVQQLSAIAPAVPMTIVAEVVASGRYDNGNSFTTGPYKVAVSVCSGCLTGLGTVSCPTGQSLNRCPGNAVVAGFLVVTPASLVCQ
jgi:hypothetical protein